MKDKICLRTLTFLTVALVAVAMTTAGPAFARTHYLIAKPLNKTMPDGTVIPMWGYAVDQNGACWNTVVGDPNSPASRAARMAAAACTDPVATVPGPSLALPPNDSDLVIRLVNLLPQPSSIVIAGQEMPSTFNVDNGPTWNDGSTGPRPNPAARVRSFGRESLRNGGRNNYRWKASKNNAFQDGSYVYYSGTHPQVQVQMGLYGAVRKKTAAGDAYPGVPMDTGLDLFFSEIDPALHQAVADGTYGRRNQGGPTSTLNYKPKYFLVNGEPQDHNSTTLGPCIDSGAAQGNRILLRMYNMGLHELAPMMLGSHFDVVAEGGKPYPFPRRQYQVLLMPGSTKDAIFTPASAGNYPIIDRRLNLTNAAATGGGMQTCITVAGGGP